MKRIARILTLALIVTFLLSLPTSAVELPIRVVVNGTKINFPMQNRLLMRIQGHKYQSDLLGKPWVRM